MRNMDDIFNRDHILLIMIIPLIFFKNNSGVVIFNRDHSGILMGHWENHRDNGMIMYEHLVCFFIFYGIK